MRFLLLRNTTGRLGLRSRQAALLLRGNNVTEGWDNQTSTSETWTNQNSTSESWTNQ